jgi:hypothetical protein
VGVIWILETIPYMTLLLNFSQALVETLIKTLIQIIIQFNWHVRLQLDLFMIISNLLDQVFFPNSFPIVQNRHTEFR